MTPLAQRIAIAQACGWKNVHISHKLSPTFYKRLVGDNPVNPAWFHAPQYCTNLNAMHEAEKILSPTQSEVYVSVMDNVMEIPTAFYGTARRAYLVMHATANQRAEAFLRTLNLWDNTK